MPTTLPFLLKDLRYSRRAKNLAITSAPLIYHEFSSVNSCGKHKYSTTKSVYCDVDWTPFVYLSVCVPLICFRQQLAEVIPFLIDPVVF